MHHRGHQQGRRVGRRGQQPRQRPQPVGGRGVAGPAQLLVGHAPARPARAGGPAPAAASAQRRHQREQLGRDPDRVGWATSSPAPARTSASDDADPSSTALAWAPRSSDSAVCSGEVRRRPRSRSITSIPSRAAAYAEGTPSRVGQPGQRDPRSWPRRLASAAPGTASPSR